MSTPVSPEFEVAVFKKGVKTTSIASERISKVEAQWFVDCGAARWVNNRYNSIIMLMEALPSKMRDQSAQMGPRVIEQFAMGDTRIAALVDAWRPVLAA
jgi:hypothetical protein